MADTTNERKALFRKDYAPTPYKITDVKLNIDLDKTNTIINSDLHVTPNPASTAEKGAPLALDGEHMQLQSIKILENGTYRELSKDEYDVTPEQLILKNPPSGDFDLKITNSINPTANTWLSGMYMAGDLICTQCESQGFRNITYFLDRPDNLAKFDVTLEANKDEFPTLLSNGNGDPKEAVDLGNGRHRIEWKDPWPKPSYLFAVMAGKLEVLEDTFTTMSGKKVDLRIYVEPGYETKTAWAMQSIKRAMKWDEEKYGREYDLDCFNIAAVTKFNFGAMENKGLNIYNISTLVGSPETTTDEDLTYIERVVAHEYFHNWTGDRVTLRDWFELTLKEGLTVLRDRQFTADLHSPAIKIIADARDLRTRQFAEDAGPSSLPIRPERVEEFENIYTGTTYQKGSHVLGMMRTMMGNDVWRASMDEYFNRFDGQAVTCDDFVDVMQDISGIDLTQFRRWYSQSGTPEISYDGVYDADKKTYTLTLKQSTPATADQPLSEKQPLHMPIAVGLIGESGKDIPLSLAGSDNSETPTTRILHLKDAEQTYVFENVNGPVVPSILRGFSAPVKIVTQPSEDELLFRMAHDSDPFNKYEATERLMTNTILSLIKDYESGKQLTLSQSFLDAYQSNLLNALDGDKDFAAYTLALPPYSLITQNMTKIDPDATMNVLDFVRETLAKTFKDDYKRIYDETNAPAGEKYDVVPDQVGRRSLHNVCLSFLGKLDTPDVQQLAEKQFSSATNMTEQESALVTLSKSTAASGQIALDAFYERFKDDVNVVDTWLNVSASRKSADPVAHVKELMTHEAFDITNPNKVRSVIGGFLSDPRVFHNKDGSGYKFLADMVIRLNELNPSTGARLVDSLTKFKKYDGDRQTLMIGELKRIMATPKLDKSIKEFVGKALDTVPANDDSSPSTDKKLSA